MSSLASNSLPYLRCADSVLRAATGIAPSLSRQGLVIVGSQVKTELLPSVEVAAGGDGAAAGPLGLAVGDVLPEGGSALDGGLVDLLVLPNVIDGAVAGDGADLLALRAAGAV